MWCGFLVKKVRRFKSFADAIIFLLYYLNFIKLNLIFIGSIKIINYLPFNYFISNILKN